ncbi:uncharacterized protein LOC123525558 [Mercenaria mercenaria]|uniref:uncharacterized protein LOC123525558 n=1 Tax=Mercenaria mercenaria TaxID=6596 RepID=UPI00234EF093|nr:uncharacterized protein LOC123525558 [Mercenaria mercenaria]
MFHLPDYTHNVSLWLSQVMSDIGVNEKMVIKRRRACLLQEAIADTSLQLEDWYVSFYELGSQVEATTTQELNSDYDHLLVQNTSNVIQDLSDWELGKANYLMIQDETVSPGYCLLQCLRDDAPLPLDSIPNKFGYRDSSGRILLRNTVFNDVAETGDVKHGPAYTRQGRPGYSDTDAVLAIPCKTWPRIARRFLDHQGVGVWPLDEIKLYCSTSRCFVVGVGSKGNANEELEWRISTSLAERCLMFNLNITQIRCYILMKMILNTYIKPQFEDTISSFICKTSMFHCKPNTHYNFWKENNLLFCLTLCLIALYNCILYENCPYFIINENNLMAGRISPETKQQLLEIMHFLINSMGTALLGIEYDELGVRLECKLTGWYDLVNIIQPVFEAEKNISGNSSYNRALYVCTFNNERFLSVCSYGTPVQTLLKFILRLTKFRESEGYQKIACNLLAPFLCTSLGSALESISFHQYNSISQEALTWMSLGLNSDVSSSRLKLASMFYSNGDNHRNEMILRDIEDNYDLNLVEPICACYLLIRQNIKDTFNETVADHDEEAMQYTTAFCVRFLPCEINCVPQELRHEMFRSTEEDLTYRGVDDFWMDWAVVDSLPYLYFLQYKTYSYLGRHDETQAALSCLIYTIDNEVNLGHRETALNLLGQCMEQKGQPIDALRCYLLSLKQRERNNAAKVHICRLLCTMINTN